MNNDKRTPSSSINLQSRGVSLAAFELNVSSFDIPVPVIPQAPQIPVFKGRKIPAEANITFNAQINFNMKSDEFKDINLTDKTLKDLIMTLKEYPQLKVLILGNAGSKNPNNTINSRSILNGKNVSFKDLMLARAKAVEQFLINRGVDWRRINVGVGKLSPDNLTSTFIIKN